MRCNLCNYEHSKVVETYSNKRDNMTRRRRECVKCGTRFTTQERIHSNPNYVTTPPKRILER